MTSSTTIELDPEARTFPEFSLSRLLQTVFEPEKGERVCVLIDLKDPAKEVVDFGFLKNEELTVQKYAYDVFYQGLKNGVMEELGLVGGEFYAYVETGGSNLDMEDECWDVEGNQLSFEKDIYTKYDLILCVSTFSATAPLTAHAKNFGFRGATLHGLNQKILDTGLSVDYDEVSEMAEKMRLGMTKADKVEIDYELNGKKCMLTLELEKQEAQKSHGLCRGKKPDIANLPAGEIYYVPTDAQGELPMKYEDGTFGLLTVVDGKIVSAELVAGSQETIDAHNEKLTSDPMTGALGELGFGTQVLPFSGRDIQDEKVLGTFHVATGRDDHLGGHLTPDLFKEAANASHDDVLFAPHKTPEIGAPEVRLYKDGEVHIVCRDYKPAEFVVNLLNG